MNTQKIEPKRLKGFEDWFAKDMKIREFVINTFKETYEKYGYEPLETPALELKEMMVGLSGSEAEKQFYAFEDPGGREVMMKYEVMTSMCRAVAQNRANLPFPYKRYQIQRVWRAENVQKGRYREFTQCDADTIGSKSMVADAEFIQMGLEVIQNLGFKKFVARISNRKFLEGLSEYIGVTKENFYGFCMSLDKLEKIGAEKVIVEMVERRGVPQKRAEEALNLIDPKQFDNSTFAETVEAFRETIGKTEIGAEGLDELLEINEYLKAAKVDEKLYKFDTSIARGLASYTGPVWEFSVIDGNVGAIAGCGRYDETIGKFLGEDVPATGGSFGIERICDIIKDRNMLDLGETTIDVMIAYMDGNYQKEYVQIANILREAGANTMLYPEAEKLGKQFKYADKKGIRWVLVIGSDEIEKKVVTLKDMTTGEQETMDLGKALDKMYAAYEAMCDCGEDCDCEDECNCE